MVRYKAGAAILLVGEYEEVGITTYQEEYSRMSKEGEALKRTNVHGPKHL